MEEIEFLQKEPGKDRKLRRKNEIGVGSKSALRRADKCMVSGI
jgi:hypothetical protein